MFSRHTRPPPLQACHRPPVSTPQVASSATPPLPATPRRRSRLCPIGSRTAHCIAVLRTGGFNTAFVDPVLAARPCAHAVMRRIA